MFSCCLSRQFKKNEEEEEQQNEQEQQQQQQQLNEQQQQQQNEQEQQQYHLSRWDLFISWIKQSHSKQQAISLPNSNQLILNQIQSNFISSHSHSHHLQSSKTKTKSNKRNKPSIQKTHHHHHPLTLHSEPSIVPSLISNTNSTSTSTTPSLLSFEEDETTTLDSKSIRLIHSTYNHRSRELFGADLSPTQILQIHQHLDSLTH